MKFKQIAGVLLRAGFPPKVQSVTSSTAVCIPIIITKSKPNPKKQSQGTL